nr:hypothetical protein [Phycicoccus sp. Soil802]
MGVDLGPGPLRRLQGSSGLAPQRRRVDPLGHRHERLLDRSSFDFGQSSRQLLGGGRDHPGVLGGHLALAQRRLGGRQPVVEGGRQRDLPCGGRAIPSGPGGQPRRGAGHPGVGGDG